MMTTSRFSKCLKNTSFFSIELAARALIAIGYVVFLTSSVRAEDYVEFLLDSSVSMAEKLGAEPKVELARHALTEAVKQLPRGTRFAVRTFGHRVDQNHQAESCQDSELIIPFNAPALDVLGLRLNGLKPKGYTALAYSLAQVAADFPAQAGRKTLVLMTDGADTCGGDPEAIVSTLKKKGFEVQVQVLGIALDVAGRKSLQTLAAVSGGVFVPIYSGVELTRAAVQVTNPTELKRLIDQQIPGDIGGLTDAGADRSSALTIQPGAYKNSFLGGKDLIDTFLVPAREGEKFIIRLHWEDRESALSVVVHSAGGVELVADSAQEGSYESEMVLVADSGELQIAFSTKSQRKFEYQFEVLKQVDFGA